MEVRRFGAVSAGLFVIVLASALPVSPAEADFTAVDTIRISVSSTGAEANGPSSYPAICDDGSTIVYASSATNLVPDDTNGISDVLAYDVATGVTTRIGSGWEPAISGDCGTIVYDDGKNVFAYDVATGETTIVSVDNDGNPIDLPAFNETTNNPDVSYDGGVIVYSSDAATLVPDDTNLTKDVFAYDVATEVTTRVSVLSDGSQLGLAAFSPVISGDGETVAFYASGHHLFTHDLVTGVTTSPPSTVIQANALCASGFCGSVPSPLALSYDGNIIVYEGYVINVGGYDVYAYDFASGVTTHVSVGGPSRPGENFAIQPTLSRDGTTVVFLSTPLAGGARPGLYASTIGSGSVSLIGGFGEPALSGDGTMVVYTSGESDLVPGDTNGVDDIFLTRLANDAGAFSDDDGSVFEADIEWLAASGITKGCNPPINDLFCPDRTVTRGQMAAFLHRALPDLPEIRPAIDFTDDNESIFEADIEWLYSRGVTQGTSATTFGPDRPVTRGQMAAFLVRALKYSDNGGGDLFIDDDTSQFEGDIDRLGTAGVTRGCNPPTNDRFCPDGFVTRGQMAAFLHRALGD